MYELNKRLVNILKQSLYAVFAYAEPDGLINGLH